jgi:hypothetical protein
MKLFLKRSVEMFGHCMCLLCSKFNCIFFNILFKNSTDTQGKLRLNLHSLSVSEF